MTHHRKHATLPQSRPVPTATETQSPVASGDKGENAGVASAEAIHHTREEAEADSEHFDGKTTE